MLAGQPILELAQFRPATPLGELPSRKISLAMMPGDVALVEARDRRRAAWFADLCAGLVAASKGAVRFLGHDWVRMPDHYAAALRGRIGRVFADGGWIDFLDVPTNIMLPQLHHTRDDEKALRDRATELACAFGLPGLPLGHVG